MPNITTQTRWRIKKDRFNTWWQVWALMPDNMTRMPGTVRVTRTWAGAMGHANLQIARVNGRLPG